jgi:hypothetical protein
MKKICFMYVVAADELLNDRMITISTSCNRVETRNKLRPVVVNGSAASVGITF